MRRPVRSLVIAAISVLLLAGGNGVLGQESKPKAISATAMGTSTQLGRVINIDIRISEASTPDDQKALLEAFAEGGSEGLANALEKMSSKGRIAITGTLGFDLKYIRVTNMPDGTVNVRFVTDRPVRFAEHWAATRSMDYSLAMGEIFIGADKDKSSGTLVPAAKLYLDKKDGLTMEAFQNPWKLVNIKVW